VAEGLEPTNRDDERRSQRGECHERKAAAHLPAH
jgi:hypothetical protein